MFHTINIQMILVSDKSKIISKSHDKLLDVLNYLLFNYTFVSVNAISLSDFLNINKIKQIFIFKHHNSFSSH